MKCPICGQRHMPTLETTSVVYGDTSEVVDVDSACWQKWQRTPFTWCWREIKNHEQKRVRASIEEDGNLSSDREI